MQNELKLDRAIADPQTGFLSFPNPNGTSGFGPPEKLLFLETYQKTGNLAKAAKLVGVSVRIISSHMAADKAFKAAYDETLEAMVNELEQTMFERAKDPKGTLDRFGWLRAHKPGKYGPKSNPEGSGSKTEKLEQLFNKILDAEVVKPE